MSKPVLRYEIWQPFLLSAMVVLGMIIGVKLVNRDYSLVRQVDMQGISSPVGRIEEVIRFIESRYVDTLNKEDLYDLVVEKIMENLDPHSVYISPDQINYIHEQMEGNYRGIGVESFFLDDTVRISRVLDGTPAHEAGIYPFDRLITIDDTIVAGRGMEYDDIRKMLKPPGQTNLKLGILRDNVPLNFNVPIVNVNLQSSGVAYVLEDGIGYIKVDRFSSNTYKEFMISLERLVEEDKIKNLVIDLRGNPGGYLPETVNILSQLFDEKGRLLVYTQGKSRKKTEYKSTGKNFFRIDKIAVLIDEGSASGSEIIAGAIQDWDRGIVIGRRSYGKGLVQEQYPLRNGGAIRLTISRYYTPSGRSIQRPYDNGDEYNGDIFDRFHNGEMFDPYRYKSRDTTPYHTLVLKRNVFGGGGIFPDVYIPLDSVFSHYELMTLSNFIPEFVFKKREEGSLEYFMEKNLDVADFWDFMADQGYHKDQNNSSVSTDDLKTRIRAEYAYQSENEIARDKILNENNPFITAALEYIRSNLNILAYHDQIIKKSR